jgi:hypothetical protein
VTDGDTSTLANQKPWQPPETSSRENNLGNMERPQRNLMLVAILMALLAAGAWTYRLVKVRAEEAVPKGLKKVTLDLRFTAPVGYEFCTGKSEKGDDRPPEKLAHTNLNLTMRLPEKITGLPADALFGTKEIVFRPGERDVDVYKHLDSGRLIHTHGTIHLENGRPVLNVLLNMGDWPPGRYVVGIGGDPFFGYCTIDFED